MTTEKNTEVNEHSEEDTGLESNLPALLAPRYLLPAIIENNKQSNWSIRQIAAVIAILIVLAGLVALYIHGGSVAASL